MARLISSKTLWQLHHVEGRADAIRDWLRANSIDPDRVSADHDVVVEDRPDGPVIRYTEILRNENGRPYPTASGDVAAEERSAPLVVEPPEGWPKYAVPDGPADA
ncbi:hypothetical protein ACWDE0_21970 [Streptomyces sp. 900105755]